MVKALTISKSENGANGLRIIDVALTELKADEVLIKHTAIEVNFIDILHRKGLEILNNSNQIPGFAAVGTVEKVGSAVNHLSIGDKVCYVTQEGGAYTTHRNITADNVVVITNPKISDKHLAACLVKGLIAYILVRRTYLLPQKAAVIVHSAAGGVGQLLANLASKNACYVAGTIGSEEKRAQAMENGCYQVFNRKTEDWVAIINDVSSGMGVNVVYDSLGMETLDKSLQCLTSMGICAHYGDSSGATPTINLKTIKQKSLFYTRPSLFDYFHNRNELLLAMHSIQENLVHGVLKPVIKEFPLDNAIAAHQLLESGKSIGAIVLIP